ncbi:hypothetical protein [Streptomyces apocyni]|uniref:hypothetical protein n=1 Tax=Streptomyces apocyni TaxID=2654677 RepID=UPI0012EA0506|nr:hypothetical protein [Streptomyces apocyni]
MPRPCPRRRAALNALLSVLLVALTAGAFCGVAGAGSGAGSGRAGAGGTVRAAPAGAGEAETSRVAAARSVGGDVDVVRVLASDQGPGCGQRDAYERDGQPAAPPRGGAAYELLTALAHAHGASPTSSNADVEARLADGGRLGAAPDRGPPPRDPPTPVQLSVLRV